MKRHDKLADTLPVGTLGILALESSHDMGKRVNDYIVDWRKDRAAQNATASTFAGYNRDSFLIDSACPRFGSGEAKGIINESVRGDDLYLLVDVCNYSLTYTVADTRITCRRMIIIKILSVSLLQLVARHAASL